MSHPSLASAQWTKQRNIRVDIFVWTWGNFVYRIRSVWKSIFIHPRSWVRWFMYYILDMARGTVRFVRYFPYTHSCTMHFPDLLILNFCIFPFSSRTSWVSGFQDVSVCNSLVGAADSRQNFQYIILCFRVQVCPSIKVKIFKKRHPIFGEKWEKLFSKKRLNPKNGKNGKNPCMVIRIR